MLETRYLLCSQFVSFGSLGVTLHSRTAGIGIYVDALLRFRGPRSRVDF